ncbi:hypothetical protein LRAMOSA03856 [Lichtheimia ramosa]|uniref:DUF2415 domain-containing protein n=1 Tax=Lichtheimia ramosa TaxID=688394 RepID=A0A077WX42_9FUNG|nr:hypothetical protein LRAMOSA03856 [Lichtheimia ramosa]
MFAYPTFSNNNYPLANTKPTAPQAPPATTSTIYDDGSFVSSEYKTYPVDTTIQHWQLRNLIHCPKAHNVLHPQPNALNMFNTKTGEDTPILTDLPFTPTTMDTAFGYIAIAGPRGMGMVKDLSGSWSAHFTAGPGMNNSITLSKHHNGVRVTVCNNDQSVCIMSVPNMERIATLRMPAAINHASVSPDGRMMLMVGDNGMVYLYEITASDDYKQMAVYQASEEPALSCAWNQSSEKFAVTSQDGIMSIWQVGNPEPLHKIASTETRKTRKAPRAIQFSKGPLDLLAYSEHVSTVNIIDTRTFETRQLVRLSPRRDMDYHISGMSFSPDNRYLYVGFEDAIVQLDVDVCARRQFGSSRLC